MTRFADQLFDDLMREHGDALARTTVRTAPKRYLTARPVLLTAGAGGVAAAAAIGTLVAGGGTPAYAVTTHPDGTVTLAVYQKSGIAEANAKLHELGDRVVVVPVKSGCPSIDSLPAAAVAASAISVQVTASNDGSVTVDAHGVPVGDILVLGLSDTGGQFQFSVMQAANGLAGHASGTSQEHATASGSSQGHAAASGPKVWGNGPSPGPVLGPAFGAASRLTSGPAPACVSIPATASPGSLFPTAPVLGPSSGASVSNS